MAKKKKGPYRSKVKIGVDANGKDIVKWIQGNTREELRSARQQVIAYYITGEALENDRLFGDYATEWYRVRKEPNLSASSKESYRTALNLNILPVFGERKLRAISAMELQDFLNSFAGKSKTKITVVKAALRGIFSSARTDRLIPNNPASALTTPTAAKPKPKYALEPDTRARISAVCYTHASGHYLALLYYLGLRPGEARGLQWGDIDWDTGRIHVQRDIDYKAHGEAGELKTASSDRRIPMPEPLVRILRPRRGFPDAYVVSGTNLRSPLAKTSGERVWVDLMAACGLVVPAEPNKYRPGDPRSKWKPVITPHALRHNYITMCWENGFDPYTTMQLVGHTSIKTTLDIYTHLSETMMESAAIKIEDMFAPKVAKKLQNQPWQGYR